MELYNFLKITSCDYNWCLPGTLVPNATIVIAVMESLMWLQQPKCDAMSPITAVKTPILNIDMKKVGHPLQWSYSHKKRHIRFLYSHQ